MRRFLLLAASACALASAADSIADNIADLPGFEEAMAEASSTMGSVAESFTSSTASSAIETPTFTPTVLKAPFFEQFTGDWESRWRVSHAKKENTEEEWAYVGTWSVEEPTVLRGIEGDKGLVLKNKAAHHAISAKFAEPIDNKGKTLVVQYEAKFQTGLECGGAYMKLLQDNKALKTDEFSNASPYIIMFGPDKCGSTNKVHFIFRHKNPKTGEYEEKHLKTPPSARVGKTTSLYTLIVNPDQTFQINIDGKSVRNGSLLEDFTPAVNPDKEIDDPKDKKPADWVDEAKIADPDAKKPADWDEDEPYEILDTEATKPADWLEDEPKMIPDPEAQKPADWDDEEDGDWQPPMVSNLKCEEASGCGPWEPPMKKNPAYKGKWVAEKIDNPAYKGVWKPRKIPNPDYYEDKKPSDFEPMGAIGFELWTMQNDILFDNIYIGHSVKDAQALQKDTFDVKSAVEKQEDEKTKPKPADSPKSPSDLKFMDDPVYYVREKFDLFMAIAKRDPIEAVKFVPEIAGGLGVVAVTVLALLMSALGIGAQKAPSMEEMKAKAKAAADQVSSAADAVSNKVQEEVAKAHESASSSAEIVQEEVKKRTTRSSAEK